jgi:hypothetical protein
MENNIEKIYQCEKCKKIFRQKNDLFRHKKRKIPCEIRRIIIIEDDETFYPCDYCNKKYETKSGIRKHLLSCVEKKIIDAIAENNKINIINELKNKVINDLKPINIDKKEVIDDLKPIKLDNNKAINDLKPINIDKNINIVKYFKKKIPPNLKIKVWNKYIGDEIGKSKCTCCKLIDIYQASFSCGHIISEFNGGENKIDNLMPICNSCNSSMGIKDMNEYKKEFFDNNIEKKNVNKINEQKTKNIIINGNVIINRNNVSNNH